MDIIETLLLSVQAQPHTAQYYLVLIRCFAHETECGDVTERAVHLAVDPCVRVVHGHVRDKRPVRRVLRDLSDGCGRGGTGGVRGAEGVQGHRGRVVIHVIHMHHHRHLAA